MPNVHGENAHYFYQNGKLNRLQRQGASYTIFRQESRPLALRPDSLETDVLVTTPSNTVIASTSNTHVFTYDAYGYSPDIPTDGHLLGFNGEPRIDARGYFLGNGYRTYNPILRRFNSPDDESPFGAGGISAYAYCAGDPVNLIDPSGRSGRFTARFPKWDLRSPVAKIVFTERKVLAETTSSKVQQPRAHDPSKGSLNNPVPAQSTTLRQAHTNKPHRATRVSPKPMAGESTSLAQQAPRQSTLPGAGSRGLSPSQTVEVLKAVEARIFPDSRSGFMSHNVKTVFTLIAGSGVAAGIGYGIYAIVKKVREEPYYGAS